MIYTHSLGFAARYHADRLAISGCPTRQTFRGLDKRVARVAAMLAREGFVSGDRLALLLPNGPEFLEFVFACARLGVVAMPLDTQWSSAEIARVLADAKPRGLIRHSSLAVPAIEIAWQRVLDKEPLQDTGVAAPPAINDPDAALALIYVTGSMVRPKGVLLTHGAAVANFQHANTWMRLSEHSVYLHAAPLFHIADFPFVFAATASGACQLVTPRLSPSAFCQTVQRERVSHSVLLPTTTNLLAQLPELHRYDLSSVKQIGYSGSPITPETIRQTKDVFRNLTALNVYGLSETGFLTTLLDDRHTPNKLPSHAGRAPARSWVSLDRSGASPTAP